MIRQWLILLYYGVRTYEDERPIGGYYPLTNTAIHLLLLEKN